MAAGRMDDQTGLFVYHDKMGILIEDDEWNGFWLKIIYWRWREEHLQSVILTDRRAGLGHLVVDFHATQIDQLLNLIAANSLEPLLQVLVQSLLRVPSNDEAAKLPHSVLVICLWLGHVEPEEKFKV